MSPVAATHLSFEYKPSAPYSLERTAQRFSRFPERVDVVRDGGYQRLLFVSAKALLVRVDQVGPPSRPKLRVRLTGEGARRKAARVAAEALLERALGTRHRLAAFYRQFADDALIGTAIRTLRGLSIAGHADLFEALVTTVLAQQVNLTFAYSIRQELVEKLGKRGRVNGETWYAFPEPQRIARMSPGKLRAFRLSGAKASTLLRIARAIDAGELDEAQLRAWDDERVIEHLTAVKGIGRWTAETALIRGLGRCDAFPAGDLGVVKYLAQGLLGQGGRASEGDMRAFAERWKPYRAYALVYAYAELARRRAG